MIMPATQPKELTVGRKNGQATIAELAKLLGAGAITSVELVSSCLERITDPCGEGVRAFRVVDADTAIEAAVAIDKLRDARCAPSPFAGIPISVTDLFDIEGQSTLAGSVVHANNPPAIADAPVIARLRQAGFIIVGRTNMTEFAYSGLGLNPHYGTPRNPFDRITGRIPGGSSSGAAVSVSDGMAAAGLGTDTGGSCRIPAAMCGIVGFKPTQRRVPLDGVTPLSFSLDSVGPLANSVACCAIVDSIIAAESAGDILAPVDPEQLKIAVLRNYVFGDADDIVVNRFEQAVGRLSAAGVEITDLCLPFLDELPEINANGGLAAAEAYAFHQGLLKSQAAKYDPRVSSRIAAGAKQSAADYISVIKARHRLISDAVECTRAFDAVIYPTVPIVAPPLDSLTDDDEYARVNLLALRNPMVTNVLDRCAISLPIHQSGEAPVGLNLMGHNMQDRRLLAIANSLESILQSKIGGN